MAGRTPAALMTKSASTVLPVEELAPAAACPAAMDSTLAPVKHLHALGLAPAGGSCRRRWAPSCAAPCGHPLPPRVSCTPRAASASMMMQPMKAGAQSAAPCALGWPRPRCCGHRPASSRCARPQIQCRACGGRIGCEPVAISSGVESQRLRRCPASTVARSRIHAPWHAARTSSTFRSSKVAGLLRR